MNNQVDAIVQGPDNYLWVVPPVGLMRFDGVRFSRFPLDNFIGASDDHISAALCDRAGTLWLATFSGTVIGIRPDFSTVKIPETTLTNGFGCGFAEGEAGTLWLAYPNTVCRIKDRHTDSFGLDEGVPAGTWHSFISDGAGNIWLAKGNQICVYRNGRFRRITTALTPQGIAATPTNAVWLVAGQHLFTCNTDGTLRDRGVFPGLSDAAGRALLEDHTGAVWIGTGGKGLIRYSGSGFEKIDTPYPFILTLADDREGNIWVGTDGGGMDRVSARGIRLESLESSPLGAQIESICQNTNGDLWGADGNGFLVTRTNGLWTRSFTNLPSAGTITCVAADGSGSVWIGTRKGELLRLVNANCPVLAQKTSHGAIDALLPTSSGNLWIVAYRSLQRLHDGQLQDFKLPRPIGKISAIAEDAAGNVWVSAESIILRYDGSHFVDETPCLPVSGRKVCCLYGTADGSMWVGGGGFGLFRFRNGQVDQIGLDRGLFDDYISQIVSDKQGWLWFGSDHGIFKIRQRELNQAMDDRSIRLRPIVYGRNEGLSGLAALFSTGLPFALPQAIRTRDGQVCLLTHTGVVVADPAILPEQYSAPPALLTRIAMDGQTIAAYGGVISTQIIPNLKTPGAPLRLPPGHRHLEFEFTAFNFSAPESIHFRYQLMGLDNGWIDADTERSANYSRLVAGNYQFRVAASVGDGPWSEAPATFAFIVTPFFWQTWWFRGAGLLFLVFAAIAIVRYVSFRRWQAKMRLLEQRAALDRERTRIARDLHDDLGGSLNLAALTLDIAQRETSAGEPLNEKIHDCSTIVREASCSVDEIVWAINPRNDRLDHLVDYLSQFAVEYLQAAGILCIVDLPGSIVDQEIPPEVRYHLFLAVKEALNNITRHARAGKALLHVTVSKNQIAISIQDDGRGFEGRPDNASSDGLRNMRQRMEQIGGQFQLTSRPGAGTKIDLLYSWPSRS